MTVVFVAAIGAETGCFHKQMHNLITNTNNCLLTAHLMESIPAKTESCRFLKAPLTVQCATATPPLITKRRPKHRKKKFITKSRLRISKVMIQWGHRCRNV
jgi:hypothetical protein